MTRKPKPMDLVLAAHPKAQIEAHREAGRRGRRYYLIRLPGHQIWSGNGDTKTQAWHDAAIRLGLLKEAP